MLVYGDRTEASDLRERLFNIVEQLAAVANTPPGIERHAKLVSALIEAGELQQGIEDAGAASQEIKSLVYKLSFSVIRSWDTGFAEVGEISNVSRVDGPASVELKQPEGFAFYAVYPESYVASARRLRLVGLPRVIGVRSIGTTLGSVVAATLNAPPPVTIRPFGDPFARKVELPAEIIEPAAHYVIVDEGPGLSGSSFGAVADWLQERGVPLERIAFMPSHDGDLGPCASEAHRARWHSAQRVPATFDPEFLEGCFGRLKPFSADTPGERLKYFGDKDGERVLLKFAGLGATGERKLAIARTLHATGFTAEPLGLIHGFLVERWCADARPLGLFDQPVTELGRYIGARARLLPAPDGEGATLDQLREMTRRNFGLSFGCAAAAIVDSFGALGERPRVRTDNKLDRHEWLRGRDGRLIKTDALDHHQGHDLIGCQPPEWDVAGAMIEFGLDQGETDRLIDATALSLDHSLLGFFQLAYTAFRLGHAVLTGGADAAVYRRKAELLLQSSSRDSARILA